MATTTSSNTPGKTADNGNWIHGCFIVRIGTDFKTYQDILKYTQQDEIYGGVGKPALDPNVKKILDSQASADGPLPLYFSKRKCRDSSLGGNDAINPLPQFSLDDDLSHPHFYQETGTTVAMGRVYSENYDDLQQILYLGFGIPVFNDMSSFWATATDLDMAKFVNRGSGITLEKIGYLIGSAPARIIKIATIPYKFIAAMSRSLQDVPISKYYTFSSQMPMYFRFVNTIMAMLATNMNIVGSSTDLPTTGSNTSGTTAVGLTGQGTSGSNDMSGISGVFKNNGLDMAQIMLKRFYYENGNKGIEAKRWTDQSLFDSSNLNGGRGVGVDPTDPNAPTTPTADTTNSETTDTPPKGRTWLMQWFDNFVAAGKGAIFDGHLFIGFRIDKGMGASESFSNSTGESQIAQLMNEKYQAGKESTFQTMDGSSGDSVLANLVSGAVDVMRGALTGISATLKLDPLAAAATGSATISIPEVWTSSSYSRTQNFTITCLSPYGDFESIFQSEYVPLACILAGTLPRGTGPSSHSSPFVCQAYCRGIFSSPLCMIESLEITRGADQFGMTQARLPLKLTMHVTLKDLSPVMYMTMGGDRGVLNAIFGRDDNFAEYMMTLSGMGLRDRLGVWQSMRRKWDILVSTFSKNRLSPYMLGMEAGDRFLISRMISTIVSGGRNLPGN